eukprot:g1042.t1
MDPAVEAALSSMRAESESMLMSVRLEAEERLEGSFAAQRALHAEALRLRTRCAEQQRELTALRAEAARRRCARGRLGSAAGASANDCSSGRDGAMAVDEPRPAAGAQAQTRAQAAADAVARAEQSVRQRLRAEYEERFRAKVREMQEHIRSESERRARAALAARLEPELRSARLREMRADPALVRALRDELRAELKGALVAELRAELGAEMRADASERGRCGARHASGAGGGGGGTRGAAVAAGGAAQVLRERPGNRRAGADSDGASASGAGGGGGNGAARLQAPAACLQERWQQLRHLSRDLSLAAARLPAPAPEPSPSAPPSPSPALAPAPSAAPSPESEEWARRLFLAEARAPLWPAAARRSGGAPSLGALHSGCGGGRGGRGDGDGEGSGEQGAADRERCEVQAAYAALLAAWDAHGTGYVRRRAFLQELHAAAGGGAGDSGAAGGAAPGPGPGPARKEGGGETGGRLRASIVAELARVDGEHWRWQRHFDFDMIDMMAGSGIGRDDRGALDGSGS